jgi:HEAT repeat protein
MEFLRKEVAATLPGDVIIVPAPDDVSALIAALAAEDAVVRRRARNGLIVLGNRAVDPLIELLADRRAHVRWEAAKALGGIGAPKAAPALVRILEEDEDFDVRWLASQALAGLGREGLRPLLVALAARPYSIALQEGAYHICHRLSRRQAFQLVKPVLAALRTSEPALAIPAAVRVALDELRTSSRPRPNG